MRKCKHNDKRLNDSATEIFSAADHKLEINFVMNSVFLGLRKFVTRKNNF